MNLYRLELKRVCKTRMTAILLAIALVLAVVMAYLPVTFIGWTELDASGNEVRYTGLKAIRKRQEQQVSGTITPDVMQEALEGKTKLDFQEAFCYGILWKIAADHTAGLTLDHTAIQMCIRDRSTPSH